MGAGLVHHSLPVGLLQAPMYFVFRNAERGWAGVVKTRLHNKLDMILLLSYPIAAAKSLYDSPWRTCNRDPCALRFTHSSIKGKMSFFLRCGGPFCRYTKYLEVSCWFLRANARNRQVAAYCGSIFWQSKYRCFAAKFKYFEPTFCSETESEPARRERMPVKRDGVRLLRVIPHGLPPYHVNTSASAATVSWCTFMSENRSSAVRPSSFKNSDVVAITRGGLRGGKAETGAREKVIFR